MTVFGLGGANHLQAMHNLGYIQVTSEPGVEVYLDGEFKGTTSEKQRGLIISGVPATRHLLRFEKVGHHLQEAEVDVGFLKVLEYKVRHFTPKQEKNENGNQAKPPPEKKVGSILIQSLPVVCTISIPDLGVNNFEKYRDDLEFDKLPVGTYSATFSALGQSVDQTITIREDERTRIAVSILGTATRKSEPQLQAGENVSASKTDSDDNQAQTAPSTVFKAEKIAAAPRAVPDISDTISTSTNVHPVASANTGFEHGVKEVKTESRVKLSAPTIAMVADKNQLIADLGLKLIWMEPGSFVMGNALGGEIDEKPVTQVSLSRGFWLGQTEVTQAQWRAITGNNPAHFQGDDLPVETVSWNEVMDFCRKLTEREGVTGRLPEGYTYTLPTEAQWEYACRAGTTGDYDGNPDATGWYGANSGTTTKPVGQKQANAWGLYDMHGNVWEWCLDWYGSYQGGSVADPKGAALGPYRVMRGGSWNNSADYCRANLRLRDEPIYRRNYLGFRLALSLVQ